MIKLRNYRRNFTRDLQKPFKYLKYTIRHRLISFLRDIDFKGFRRLSLLLPRFLLPTPDKIGACVIQTIHGIKLIINPSIDNGVERSLYETGTYEKGVLHFIQNYMAPKACFVDVGANIGLMSIFTASKFPNAKVLAFEAHPNTFDILLANTELNSVTTIDSRSMAIGNENTKVKIYDNWQINRGGASLIVKTDSSEFHEVEMRKLDDELDGIIPSMIKIDVEGVELEVLKGARMVIKKHQPILIIEVSENRINHHGSSSEIFDFVKEIGNYDIFKLAGGKERKSKLIEIKKREDLPEHDNIICIANKDF